MPTVLRAEGLSKSYGKDPLLDGVDFELEAGARVGVIGENGTGKSTFLALLAGRLQPDAGQIWLAKDQRLGVFEQSPTFPEGASVGSVLESSFDALRSDIAAYEEAVAQASPEADELQRRIEERGGWEWAHRIDEMILRLELPEREVPVETLSGGFQRRVALGALLLRDPTIILFDEPTNHLDVETIEWLEEWMSRTKVSCMLVTHDRYFLDRVVDTMVELRGGNLRRYAGNYGDYLVAREEEEQQRERRRERRLVVLKQELEWARRQPKARGGKAKARLDRIESAKDEQRELKSVERKLDFSASAAPKLAPMVLELEELHFAYPDGPPLIAGLSLTLERGERLAIAGPNGCGKTTLVELLSGKLQPTKGSRRKGGRTQVAVFDQHRSELDPDATVEEILAPQGGEQVVFEGRPLHIISWMKRFGFEAEQQRARVSTLSGGERNRLAMARFLLTEANLILLDEPTNDLDLFTLGVLEGALLDFPGAVIIVSHDRAFLDRVATGVLGFEGHQNGKPRWSFVKGGWSTWKSIRERAAAEQKKAETQKATASAAKAPKRERKASMSYKEKEELAALPQLIEELEEKLEGRTKALEDPTLWTERAGEAKKIQAEVAELQDRVTTAYARWEELLEKSEAAG